MLMQTHSKAIAFIIIREYKPTYTRQSRWLNLVLASDFARVYVGYRRYKYTYATCC